MTQSIPQAKRRHYTKPPMQPGGKDNEIHELFGSSDGFGLPRRRSSGRGSWEGYEGSRWGISKLQMNIWIQENLENNIEARPEVNEQAD